MNLFIIVAIAVAAPALAIAGRVVHDQQRSGLLLLTSLALAAGAVVAQVALK